MRKSVADHRGQGRRSPHAGRVAFLFGVAGSDRLPGTTLIRLLGDLGISHGAARTLLDRMRRRGQLKTIRRGRTADYQLAGAFAEGFRRVRSVDTAQDPIWTGSFHAIVYQVPESERAYRDAFRRVALHAGYGLLQPGLLIALNDRRSILADLLATAPPSVRIYPAQLAMASEDAKHAAEHAWDLSVLTGTLRQHVRTIKTALRRTEEPPPTAQTLRRFVQLSEAPLADLARAPSLPPDLAPSNWPLDDLRSAVTELHRHYGPPARLYTERAQDSEG